MVLDIHWGSCCVSPVDNGVATVNKEFFLVSVYHKNWEHMYAKKLVVESATQSQLGLLWFYLLNLATRDVCLHCFTYL